MTKDQATIIIILLAAIVGLLVRRDGATDLLGNLGWLALIIIILVAAGAVSALREARSNWSAKRHAEKSRELDDEIAKLSQAISGYAGPALTTEHIPQWFPSKEMAQAFGERWSRGGPDSFSAHAVDAHKRCETHPKFDRTSMSGGMLDAIPALFFGMREAHREDDAWWLDFQRAKKHWLKDYLDHLKRSRVRQEGD
jgi:hypothetical protein